MEYSAVVQHQRCVLQEYIQLLHIAVANSWNRGMNKQMDGLFSRGPVCLASFRFAYLSCPERRDGI